MTIQEAILAPYSPAMRFQSSFPASFHHNLLEELNALDPGDRINFTGELYDVAPTLPSVRAIVEDPMVQNAMKLMLPRLSTRMNVHIHVNGPGYLDWHTDNLDVLINDLNGHGAREGWNAINGIPGRPISLPIALLCYFPQETTDDMGPTKCRWNGHELSGAGPAGTWLLMRHDVPHCGLPNTSRRRRIMLKFFCGSIE